MVQRKLLGIFKDMLKFDRKPIEDNFTVLDFPWQTIRKVAFQKFRVLYEEIHLQDQNEEC